MVIERGEKITADFEGQKEPFEMPKDAVCCQCGRTFGEHTTDDHRACARKEAEDQRTGKRQ